MKYQSVFIFLFLSIKIHAQWSKISYEFPFGERDFNDIEITENDMIFIAENYFIYKSGDLGLSWDTSFHNTEDGGYYAIDFLNSDTGYIARAGAGGLGMRTYDGGETWEEIYPANGYFEYNNDVFVLNADDIYFAMSYFGLGVVQVSHDGCETSAIYTPSLTDYGIGAITCISRDTCMCISADPFGLGDASCNHNIYKSYNGGVDWEYITNVSGVKDIFCTSKNICYARGRTDIVKSTDQGETWETIFTLDSIFYFSALTFINDSMGYVAAYHYASPASVYRTTDGGMTWDITTFDSIPNRVTGIDCMDSENCFLTASGYIYKTTNGGIASINNNHEILTFNIYPNPTISQINISYENKHEIQEIITTNYLGEKMHITFDEVLHADISLLPAGIYVTEIITYKGRGVKKWVKQ